MRAVDACFAAIEATPLAYPVVYRGARRALACQTREFGWTLVTRDADFTALRKSVTGLKVAAPFPARP